MRIFTVIAAICAIMLPVAAQANDRSSRRGGAAQELATRVSASSTCLPSGRRPASGTMIVVPPKDTSAEGRLTIRNGLHSDSVVQLARGSRTVLAIYVRARTRTVVRGVPDGIYDLFYRIGTRWNAARLAFTWTCGFYHLSQFLDYLTLSTPTSVHYTSYTVTLHAVPNGNTSIEAVEPSATPRLR